MARLNGQLVEDEQPFPDVEDQAELEQDDLVYVTMELEKKDGGTATLPCRA